MGNTDTSMEHERMSSLCTTDIGLYAQLTYQND